MAVDELINMQVNLPPPVTQDLSLLEQPPARLAILGKTLNLARLSDFPTVPPLRRTARRRSHASR